MVWPGVILLTRRLLYGGKQKPKATYYTGLTPTTREYYENMNKYYRWFRQDELVRGCIVVNAFFACMSHGFETVLEPSQPQKLAKEDRRRLLDDYAYVKTEIDASNKQVNLDQILFIAQVKNSIYSKCGFEIVVDENLVPQRLLPLESTSLKPKLNDYWELTGFEYKGKSDFYQPEEVLYFVNLALEADYEGLSDLEPILDICNTRHNILREDIQEISRNLWAPFLFLEADTSGLSEQEATRALEDITNAVKPGKRVVVNQSVHGQVIDLKPDIPGLTTLLDKLELMILANFRTPRFLVGKPVENRATAYAELEAYVSGPIANIQRYFKREIEKQWYDHQTRRILAEEENLKENNPLPIVVKHRWNPIRVSDIYQMATAVAQLWGSYGNGPIGNKREKVWELMGWDSSELQEDK